MALHESQRQPTVVSAASDRTATSPPAGHSHPAHPNSSTQQEATPAEQLPTSQQQQSLDQQVQQPGSSQSAQPVTVSRGVEAQAAEEAHSAQQQGPVQEQQARSGVGTPTGTSLPDSMTKQGPQQQLLQQLAAQAGFQLVSPPGQGAPAGSAQAAMHHAEQGTPLLATLPHQQQQWAALSHDGVSNDDLNRELSHGLLQHLGQGLQSSAMQAAVMQQQQQQLAQQQSRLPAWAQQALLPDQGPPATPPAAYYGMPGLSPAHSMHALPSPPAHSMPGQYVSGGHMHEQYDPAGLRAPLGGSSSWHIPTWQQQQQQAQATPQWLLDQHAQQYGSMAAAESLHHRAVQGDGPYHTPHRSSLLNLRNSHAAVSWPFSQGGPAMGTPADPQGQHSPSLLPPQAGTADASQPHGSESRQQHSSRGEDSLPAMLQDDYADTVAAAKLSLQDSGPELGVPSVLSGGSSGVSSPLRGSGHLESLMEVNNRVEAAMGRARAQLQVQFGWCIVCVCHVMCM